MNVKEVFKGLNEAFESGGIVAARAYALCFGDQIGKGRKTYVYGAIIDNTDLVIKVSHYKGVDYPVSNIIKKYYLVPLQWNKSLMIQMRADTNNSDGAARMILEELGWYNKKVIVKDLPNMDIKADNCGWCDGLPVIFDAEKFEK